jgi:DNA polymerase I-like protein with 3'-5' exonuclease and polymerase domains
MQTPENLIYSFDLRQAEWVVCAYYARDGYMIDAVENKRDIHVQTGGLITGIPFDLIVKENKVVGQATDPDWILDTRKKHIPDLFTGNWFIPRTMSIRQMGKKSNHGLNLDEQAERFALEYEIEYGEARRIVDGYHNAYPGIQNTFHRGVQDQLNKNRTLINCWGDKRHFKNPWGRDLWKEGYAFIPQSTVVHITDRAMILLYEDTDPVMDPVQQMQEVHDNLKLQYPAGRWDSSSTMVQRVVEYMTPQIEYWGRPFTIGVELKVGISLGRMIEIPLSDNGKISHALEEAWRTLTGKGKGRQKRGSRPH